MGGCDEPRVNHVSVVGETKFDITPDELKKQRMSRVIDDSARHHYRFVIPIINFL